MHENTFNTCQSRATRHDIVDKVDTCVRGADIVDQQTLRFLSLAYHSIGV